MRALQEINELTGFFSVLENYNKTLNSLYSYGYCTKNENDKLEINYTFHNGLIRTLLKKPKITLTFEFEEISKTFIEKNGQKFSQKKLDSAINIFIYKFPEFYQRYKLLMK